MDPMSHRVIALEQRALVWRHPRADDVRLAFDDAEQAVAWLRREGARDGEHASLRRALADLVPGGDLSRATTADVVLQAARALVRGELRAVVGGSPRISGTVEEGEVAEPRPGATPKLTWVAIQLFDDQKPPKPMAGEPYRVTLSDGAVRTGILDEHGTARLEGIAPGECEVTFPRLHQDEAAKL